MSTAKHRARVAANFQRGGTCWFKWDRRRTTPERSEMAYETNPNSGTLFRNERREKDSHPNAKGKALIDGVWYWVSAWTKEPRAGGDKFQSLSFERMTEEQVEKYAGAVAAPRNATERALSTPPQRRPAPSQRPPAESPFGNEQEFDDDSIPFAWSGRNSQPI